MDPIQQLKQRLERHPELKFRITSNSVVVGSPSVNGFGVSFHASSLAYVVHFDGWHEHFVSADDALDCFAFAYSGRCRLAVTYRGRVPVKWVLEHFNGVEWLTESEVGHFFVPFWRKARVEYRQNPDVLRAAH